MRKKLSMDNLDTQRFGLLSSQQLWPLKKLRRRAKSNRRPASPPCHISSRPLIGRLQSRSKKQKINLLQLQKAAANTAFIKFVRKISCKMLFFSLAFFSSRGGLITALVELQTSRFAFTSTPTEAATNFQSRAF